MELIDSPHNQHVMLFRSLATSAGRREHGLMQVEGLRMLEEALAWGGTVAWAAICPTRLKGPRARALLDGLQERGVPVVSMTERAFQAMSDTVGPQGIAAACAIPHANLEDITLGTRARLLAMHELHDPGNMGTTIRIAAAFGCAGAIAVDECADFFSPKVIRASAGSIFHLPLVKASWEEFSHWATEQGVCLVATAAGAELSCAEAKYPLHAALVVGSEAHGLPQRVLTAADIVVRIPMFGAAESLNAAVAAGIVMYEISNGADGEK